MTAKPTVVFVPGAWHNPGHFSLVTSRLEAAGYTTRGVELASVGASTPLEDFGPDVDVIRSTLESVLSDPNQDAILFMHSYGSIPAGEACKGLDKASRRKDGHTNGISHLVYCTAFALPEGTALWDALGQKPLPWFVVSDDGKIVNPDGPEQVFCNDLSEDVAKSAMATIKPQSYRAFFSKSTYAAWKEIPGTYLLCGKDMAIPIEAQTGMAQGCGLNTEKIDASHSPFLSKPDEVTAAVRRAAGETF